MRPQVFAVQAPQLWKSLPDDLRLPFYKVLTECNGAKILLNMQLL